MQSEQSNLKAVTGYLKLTGQALADAVGADRSQVSRWLTGKRSLKAGSQWAEKIADVLLSRNLTSSYLEWLGKNFNGAGLTADFTSMADVKKNLILWLCQDNHKDMEVTAISPISSKDFTAKAGIADIALALSSELKMLKKGSLINIYLSSEKSQVILHDIMVKTLSVAATEYELKVRLLISISVSNDSLSSLANAYMCPIFTGNLQVLTVSGLMPSLVNQVIFSLPKRCAVVVSEIPNSGAPCGALIISEHLYMSSLESNYEALCHIAKPLLTSYQGGFDGSICELYCSQFTKPGNLDIYSNNLFLPYHDDFEKNLKIGTTFRVITTLNNQNQEVTNSDWIAELLSYVNLIQKYQNFQLLILAETTMPPTNFSLMIKQGRHIVINTGNKLTPALRYSDQTILLNEAQQQFDKLWGQEIYSEQLREQAVAKLEVLIKEMNN